MVLWLVPVDAKDDVCFQFGVFVSVPLLNLGHV